MLLCQTKYCTKTIKKRKYCRTCQARRYRENNPMRYCYNTLRSNCIRRKGIGWFELTFEEFNQFAVEENYLAGKGRTKQSWTIDREDPTMGYFIGNIKKRTSSFNSRKRTKVLEYDWETGIATVTKHGGGTQDFLF